MAPLPIKCHYCSQECQLAEKVSLDTSCSGPNAWNSSTYYWQCGPCNVIYRVKQGTTVTELYATIKDEVWYLALLPQSTIIAKMIYFEGRGDCWPKLIKNLNYVVPHVTPQNVADKIKLLLVFS